MSEVTAERWDDDVALPQPRKNMPVTLGKRVEALLFFGALGVLKQLPIEKASGLMGRLIRFIGPLLPKIHARGHANLTLIYPDMTDAERHAILRDCWENIGRTFAEYAHFEELPDRVVVENGEVFEKLVREGRQAVFVSGHFANWEAMGATIRKAGIKFAVVYRAPNNALVDEHIIGLRAKTISRLQIPKGKRGGRELIKALKDGYSLSMLVDQKLNDGMEVPLLGHPAMSPPAAARLAAKQNLPIIPLQMTRMPNAKFICTVHEPIKTDGQSTEELMVKINDVLGDFILARPDQWLWFHRRWPAELTPF